MDVSAAEFPPYPRQLQPVMDSDHCESKLVRSCIILAANVRQAPNSFTTAPQCLEKSDFIGTETTVGDEASPEPGSVMLLISNQGSGELFGVRLKDGFLTAGVPVALDGLPYDLFAFSTMKLLLGQQMNVMNE